MDKQATGVLAQRGEWDLERFVWIRRIRYHCRSFLIPLFLGPKRREMLQSSTACNDDEMGQCFETLENDGYIQAGVTGRADVGKKRVWARVHMPDIMERRCSLRHMSDPERYRFR